MSAILTIGDQTYDVTVEEIEMHHDGGYEDGLFSSGCNRTFNRSTISMSGFVNSITIKEDKMGHGIDRCEKSSNEESGLVKKVKNLALTDDDRLLRKYWVVYEDGELTSAGTDLLMSVLFEQNKKAIIEKLKALETAEEK